MDVPNAKNTPKHNLIQYSPSICTLPYLIYCISVQWMWIGASSTRLYASFHSLRELLPWKLKVGGDLGKGVAWGRNVKENGVMKAKKCAFTLTI
jgi:hypothetical protein